jgi:hypothetical protein
MGLEEAVKLWKELGITHCTMNFNCGGDSMGDTSFSFEDENGDVSCQELEDFFDDEVYRHVEFYENSDGHYQGESGTVEIDLNEDEGEFEYSKCATGEWSETETSIIDVELSPKMIEFIQKNISNINGSYDGGAVINFKRDFIMTNEDEVLLKEIEDKIFEVVEEYEPDLKDGELDEWFTYTTNDGSDLVDLTIEENILKVVVYNSVTVFRDDD